VVILDDSAYEVPESFNIKLENPVNAALNIINKTATVMINDNDSGPDSQLKELQTQD
jgi:hypothetical protein